MNKTDVALVAALFLMLWFVNIVQQAIVTDLEQRIEILEQHKTGEE